ncbi:hypothetical protein [Selenomonas ruminantium]|uniref:Uncharacterized protein n=1 Tax=Selenomonas ruminantium TaxID=971 RepID=A0A1K1QF50_SELRU|nr:hypothetical protein [Selenomonas ruminantium]SFW58321.1 hypothetical protein SAMN02910323_2577 [Selenomonas ruminantium]
MKVAGLEESMAGLINLEKAKAQGGTAFKDMFIGLVQERMDGSILVKEFVNGKLDTCYRKPPYLKDVPDESKPVPKTADGTELHTQRKLKKVPAVRLFEDMA